MHLSFIILIVITLTACKVAPVYNIDDTQFSSAQSASMSKIKAAILAGCRKASWEAKTVKSNKIIATYSFRDNKFSAAVIIDFDHDSYAIHYLRSSNLKYNENLPDAQGQYQQNKVEKMFDNREGVTHIHKVYNLWVKTLEKSINHEISLLNTEQYSDTPRITRASTAKQPTRVVKTSQRALKVKSSCIKVPDTIVTGQVYVKSSRANLRAGASKRCPVVGSLTKGAQVSLLGKRGGWFYIQRQNGSTAWIYNTLISLNNTAIKSTGKSIAPPPAPMPPSKRISIAVIQFKTLNKKAQDISLGELISETFTSALVNSNNFKIIEREQLDKVVKEMEMTQTGFIETTDAVEIGKMLHADAIITGSVALLNNQIQLNARIIEIESAFVISAESATTQYSLDKINQTINTIVNNLSHKLLASKSKQNR